MGLPPFLRAPSPSAGRSPPGWPVPGSSQQQGFTPLQRGGDGPEQRAANAWASGSDGRVGAMGSAGTASPRGLLPWDGADARAGARGTARVSPAAVKPLAGWA